MRLYVDTMTGTWGNAADLKLIHFPADSLDVLDDFSDLEIIAWASEIGVMLTDVIDLF